MHSSISRINVHQLIELQGARAQAFVQGWNWELVAGQYAGLIRGDNISVLSADPFTEAPTVVASTQWNHTAVELPNGMTWDFQYLVPPLIITAGAYALYIDVDIQVNPKIAPYGTEGKTMVAAD